MIFVFVHGDDWFSTLRKNTTGSKKPIAEFVVAPRIVEIEPKLVKAQLIAQQIKTIIVVHARFSFLENLPLPLTSSIESFIGKVQ